MEKQDNSEIETSRINQNRGVHYVAVPSEKTLLEQIREELINGRVKLGEKLGEGGFGVVYKLEKYPDLAIKIARESQGLNEQLIKESKNLLELTKKGYPTVYKGLIDWRDGSKLAKQGIVMERVEGAMSKQILRVGKFADNVPNPAKEAFVTQKTIKDLQYFRMMAKKDNIVIDDLQFMIMQRDGSIKLIDPARINELPTKSNQRKQVAKSYLKRIDALTYKFKQINRKNQQSQPKYRKKNIINCSELEAWRTQAESLGRSSNHLAKIDRVIHDALKVKNTDNFSQIDSRDFQAMQKDRSDFLKLNQTQTQSASRRRR